MPEVVVGTDTVELPLAIISTVWATPLIVYATVTATVCGFPNVIIGLEAPTHALLVGALMVAVGIGRTIKEAPASKKPLVVVHVALDIEIKV